MALGGGFGRIKFLLRRDKKRVEKPFKKAFKDVKKIDAADAEKLYDSTALDAGDRVRIYKSLRGHIKDIARTSSPKRLLQEWQELNSKIYSKLLRDKYLKAIKKKIQK
jgi:hypothetical protein